MNIPLSVQRGVVALVLVLAAIFISWAGCKMKSEGEVRVEVIMDKDRKDLPDNWVLVDKMRDYNIWTYRMKVKGGWLVRSMNYHGSHTGDMAFVPDSSHTWVIR